MKRYTGNIEKPYIEQFSERMAVLFLRPIVVKKINSFKKEVKDGVREIQRTVRGGFKGKA